MLSIPIPPKSEQDEYGLHEIHFNPTIPPTLILTYLREDDTDRAHTILHWPHRRHPRSEGKGRRRRHHGQHGAGAAARHHHTGRRTRILLLL